MFAEDGRLWKITKKIMVPALLFGAFMAFPAAAAVMGNRPSDHADIAEYRAATAANLPGEQVTEETEIPALAGKKLEDAGYAWWSDYDYVTDDLLGNIILTNYKGSDTEITVPATANIGGAVYHVLIDEPTHNQGGVWFPVHDTLKSIRFEEGVELEEDLSYLFYNHTALESVDLSGLKTPGCTNLISAFYGCKSLKNVKLSGFDTSKVTSMTFLFYGCSSLETIDLSSLNTSSLKVMNSVFRNCSSLKSVDLSILDLSAVNDMSGLFLGCSSLGNVKLSGADTSKVSTMTQMFYGCTSLKSMDLTVLDTRSLKKADQMFAGCTSLTGVNLTGLNTSALETVDSMFLNCGSLKSVNLTGLDLSALKDMDDMFYNCPSLSAITLGTQNTVSLETMTRMFQGCSSLTTVNLSGLDTSSLKFAYSLFANCGKLETVSMKGFDFGHATLALCANSMFSNCKALKTVYAPVGLSADSALPFGMCDSSGKGYESLPRDLTTSVLLKRLDAPALNAAVNKTAGVSVSWKKTAPAARYRIYRKLSGGSSFKQLADTAGTSYVDETAVSGKTYVYTVSPLSSDGKVEIGGMNQKGTEKLFISTPQVNAPTSAAAGVRVTWPAEKNAGKYVILRSVGSGAPDWKYLTTVAAGTEDPQVYIDGSPEVKSGTWYAYTVRAIAKDGVTYSGQTAGKAIKYLAPVQVTKALNDQKRVRVVFTNVRGGYTYRLYRSEKGSGGTFGNYMAVADVTKVDKGIPESVWVYDATAVRGKTYRYYVRCVSKDGKVALSSYKNYMQITCQ